MNESESLFEASREQTDHVKTKDCDFPWDKSDGNLFTGQMACGAKVA